MTKIIIGLHVNTICIWFPIKPIAKGIKNGLYLVKTFLNINGTVPEET